MQNRNQMLAGSFFVLLGVAWFAASLLRISFWAVCFPMGLIVLGVLFLVARPPLFGPTSEGGAHFVGNIIRSGEWSVKNEEFWMFVGNVRLDMTRAQFPSGETTRTPGPVSSTISSTRSLCTGLGRRSRRTGRLPSSTRG